MIAFCPADQRVGSEGRYLQPGGAHAGLEGMHILLARSGGNFRPPIARLCLLQRGLVWCRVLTALRLPIQAPGSDARLVQFSGGCARACSLAGSSGKDLIQWWLLVTWPVSCERNYCMEQILEGEGGVWLQAGFRALAALLAAVQD